MRQGRIVRRAALLAASAAALATLPGAATAQRRFSAELFQRSPRFVPTPADFATKLLVPDSKDLTQRVGILMCNVTTTRCMVNAMPLLSQGDPKLIAPLDAWLKTIPAADLPYKTDADGNDLHDAQGKRIQYSRYELRNAIMGYGCYDTSIVTVAQTALANRAGDMPALTNRTATFANAPAPAAASFAAGSPQAQLFFQYQLAAASQNKWSLAGAPAKAFYIAEVAADQGGGIAQKCDAYTYGQCDSIGGYVTGANGRTEQFRKGVFGTPGATLDAKTMRSLMVDGFALLIAYNRHDVKTTFDAGSGTLHVGFEDVGNYHKVAVSGFQPESYPLTINDVGNGARYRIKIEPPLSGLRWPLPAGVSAAQIKHVEIDPAFAAKSAVFYEGQYDANAKQDGFVHQVFFVDHFDGLKIDTETNGGGGGGMRRPVSDARLKPARPIDINVFRGVNVQPATTLRR